jgi:uroporphyrinogen decarboxylase
MGTSRSMTPRERVLASINHEEPDRVPIDLGSTPSSGISAIAYHNLKKHVGFRGGHVRVYDVVQQLAQPEEAILEMFKVDILDVGRAFNSDDSSWRDATLFDGTSVQFPAWFRPRRETDGSWQVYHADGTVIARMPEDGYFFDQTCFPYVEGFPADFSGLPEAMGKVLWSALVHSPWDHATDPGFWDVLRKKALYLRGHTDKALMIVVGCNLFEWGTFLRRMDNFLVDLRRRPGQVERLLDALMDVHLATLEKVCAAVGDIVNIIRFGDDLGENHGPFMSPRMYRDLFWPRHALLCKYVHDHSKMHTFLHSCGSIKPLVPDLIEAGYEILNPVQINAENMVPRELKAEFGDQVTFWGGGADTRNVLNRRSPAEVKEHVTDLVNAFAPGGGFVFAAVHNILPDVPPANVVAMFKAVDEYSGRNASH